MTHCTRQLVERVLITLPDGQVPDPVAFPQPDWTISEELGSNGISISYRAERILESITGEYPLLELATVPPDEEKPKIYTYHYTARWSPTVLGDGLINLLSPIRTESDYNNLLHTIQTEAERMEVDFQYKLNSLAILSLTLLHVETQS